ncbi:MAG: caspase family protein [Prochlorothrix sp.]|nr:caspase family protein [Prochlorothrix sp.]
MGKHWAITIGINQYQFFQPLHYAQQDAEALHRFLTTTRSLPPDQALLLAATAPRIQDKSTFPQRETLLSWVQWICNEQLQPQDTLWVFFSGHGICFENEDYLMPWEGNPDRIAETGIAVRSLLHLLHGAATASILLMLDINRSRGVQSSTLPGQQTLDLAHQFGIATLLSAQSDQFSHETADLRQGLFTTALLEGFRLHGFQTLGDLEDYLQERLPELCDHHWKPLQTAQLIGPRTLKLYPSQDTATPPTQPSPANTPIPLAASPLVLDPPAAAPASGAAALGTDSINQDTGVTPPSQPPGRFSLRLPQVAPRRAPQPTQPPQPPASPIAASGLQPTAPGGPRPPFPLLKGQNLPPWLWVILGLGLIPLGLQGIAPEWFQALLLAPTSQETTSPDPEATAPQPPQDLENFYSQALIPGTGEPTGSAPTTLAAQADATIAQLPDQSSEDPSGASPGVSAPVAPGDRTLPQPADPAPTATPAAIGQSPPTNLPTNPITSPTTGPTANQGQTRLQVRNQKILQTARTLIRGNQASQFSDAIAQARQIKPGEPFYGEAQADIARWSQTIFDLAVGRAQRGDYQGAIAAVQLVPKDGVLGTEAQQAIAYWQELKQQKEENILILEEAQLMIDFNSASSYNDAIALLRQIPEGQVYSFEAQRLMGEWSSAILALAEQRAAAGRYGDAIAAAKLVPPGMANYAAAQAAIERWSRPTR